MKNHDKILISLTDKIDKLCQEQSNRTPVLYEMFTKLEEKIRFLEHKIENLEDKIDLMSIKDEKRRDCHMCVIC